LYSRNHKPMNAPYPEIAEALDVQAPDGMVADGEIVAFDGEQTSFSTLQARIGLSDPNRARATGVPVILYLFDLLVLDGYDLTGLPLRERKRLLSEAVEFADPIRFSEHRDTDGQAYLKQACASGWEGLIAKRAEATYHPGARSKDWLKFKCVHEQELVIGSPTPPAPGPGSAHCCWATTTTGSCDTPARSAPGSATACCARCVPVSTSWPVRSPPFADPVRERGAHWVDPELVAEVGFAEWTREHQLRHTRFLGLRDDKGHHSVDSRLAPMAGFGLVLRRRRSSPIRDDRVASSAFAPVRANATAVRAAFTAGATAVPEKNRVREAQHLYARFECSYALSSNP
jgi:ATP-dependent DNA ligase